MNRERSHWLAIGMLLTGLASVVSGAIALSGFGTAPSGDLVVSSTAGTTNLLLALGALGLLCLEFAHMHRRSSRPRRVVRAPQAVRI
jgi:hypothetical protein